jgi:uncharacterized membrane protein YidH (DUF202 family)
MTGSQRAASKRAAGPPPGLQAERTDLSWTRTSLAFLVNGALLLVRNALFAPSPMHRVAAVIAFLLALFAALMAYRRRRVLAQRPLPATLASPMTLLWLGAGTAAFGAVILALICIG